MNRIAENVVLFGPSSSSALQAISLGFTILGVIFAYVTVLGLFVCFLLLLLIQP